MAEFGANFREIISHYFPNTGLISLDTSTGDSPRNSTAACQSCLPTRAGSCRLATERRGQPAEDSP
jgi:hypothetical protein